MNSKQNTPTVAIASRVFAEMERERVDAYAVPLFLEWQDLFTINPDFLTRGRNAENLKIDSIEKLYLCGDDELCREFYNALDAAHRAKGYTGEFDTCPALIARHKQVNAENALEKIGFDFCGADAEWAKMGQRKKMLELMLQMYCSALA